MAKKIIQNNLTQAGMTVITTEAVAFSHLPAKKRFRTSRNTGDARHFDATGS